MVGLRLKRLPNHAISDRYWDMGIAKRLSVPLAQVGYAWLLARIKNSLLDLSQQDGSHPTEIGTYFVACVFYAVIFRETPIGLSYQGQLDNETAQLLQQVADSMVLDETAQCNMQNPY